MEYLQYITDLVLRGFIKAYDATKYIVVNVPGRWSDLLVRVPPCPLSFAADAVRVDFSV